MQLHEFWVFFDWKSGLSAERRGPQYACYQHVCSACQKTQSSRIPLKKKQGLEVEPAAAFSEIRVNNRGHILILRLVLFPEVLLRICDGSVVQAFLQILCCDFETKNLLRGPDNIVRIGVEFRFLGK